MLEDKLNKMNFLNPVGKISLALVCGGRRNATEIYPRRNLKKVMEFCRIANLRAYSYTPLEYTNIKKTKNIKHTLIWHEKSNLPEDFRKFLVNNNMTEEEQRYKCGKILGYPECCVKEHSEIGWLTRNYMYHCLEVLWLYEKGKDVDELIAATYIPCSRNCEATLNSGNAAFLKKNFPKIFRSFKRYILKETRDYRKTHRF